MKYKVGDKVRIKSIDWYNENKTSDFADIDCGEMPFMNYMTEFCNKIVTILNVNYEDGFYEIKEDNTENGWTDDMIEGLVEGETKFGTASNPLEPKSNANCITQERVDELATKINKEPPSRNQNVWELPDGYQFIDENGNVINATKIVLEKKKPKYPTTYEECCKVMGVNHTNILDIYEHCDYKTEITYYEDSLLEKIEALYRLRICRDAYWKIAGEEMGLGKPWDSKYGCGEWGYWIGYDINENKIYCQDSRILLNRLLVFPTEEMCDVFYENFKDLIESCKELL